LDLRSEAIAAIRQGMDEFARGEGVYAREALEALAREHNIPRRNIMELHGLAKLTEPEMDAQDYVQRLRAEWDQRP
jgi:hypothetical protein